MQQKSMPYTICKQCRKRMTKTCSKSDCCCSDCSELFKEHSRYHRVWHESCKFCENILQCFPNFNFWFLNSGKKLLQVEGYHRLEHFPIKPLVDHDNLQVISWGFTTSTILSINVTSAEINIPDWVNWVGINDVFTSPCQEINAIIVEKNFTGKTI